jgi:hypothetical protein
LQADTVTGYVDGAVGILAEKLRQSHGIPSERLANHYTIRSRQEESRSGKHSDPGILAVSILAIDLIVADEIDLITEITPALDQHAEQRPPAACQAGVAWPRETSALSAV